MKTAVTLLLSLMGFALSAQVLDQTTAIQDKARGEDLAQFNRGEKIYTYQPDATGWYKMRKEVYLPLSALSGKEVPAGTDFYNADEQKIGKALADVRLKEIDTIVGFRSDDRLRAIVEGYVFKTKLKDGSVPEEQISKILETRNRTEQQEMFDQLWEEYDAESREFEDLKVYVIREQNKTTAPEKDFRLIMIFRGETSPYAVITNDHVVSADKIKDQWEEGDFKVIYFYKPSSAQKELVNTILYTYLAL